MIDNQTLKSKLKKELKQLKLTEKQEDLIVKELNYLSDLLIDVYIYETKDKKVTAGVAVNINQMGTFGERSEFNE